MRQADPNPSSDVLVVGAGVGGCTAAIRLAHRGHTVTLAERSVFPREKVCGCCVGHAGLKTLDRMGLGDSIRGLGQSLERFHGTFYDCSPVATPSGSPSRHKKDTLKTSIAPGIALARSVLDAALLQHAVEAGVQLLQPVTASVIEQSRGAVRVRLERADGCVSEESFDLVVMATGLTGKVWADQSTVTNHWIHPPSGPIGLSTLLPENHRATASLQIAEGVIEMISFREGYVGIVTLPNRSIDIAAALHPESIPGKGLQRLKDCVAHAVALGLHLNSDDRKTLRTWCLSEAQWMTTPPLRRSRKPGEGNVVMIGDAAGYFEPFTGEGMTWAIESGVAVADLWDEFFAQEALGSHAGVLPDHDDISSSSTPFADRWQTRLTKVTRRRQSTCRWVAWTLQSRWGRWMAGRAMPVAPWLTQWIVRRLASAPEFPSTVPPNQHDRVHPQHRERVP